MSKLYASTVINVAKGEVGYKEKASNANLDDKTANAGSANYTKYARDFDQKYPNWYNGKKNGYAWCDMFVDWCFLTAFGYANALALLCQPEKSAGAGCIYSYKYYKTKGQVGKTPKIGAQIFFGASESSLSHTGLVYNFDSSKVYTIEGNTSDQVAYRSYALNASNVFGYGYPAYDTENANGSTTTTADTSGGAKTSTADAKAIWDFLIGKIGNKYGVAGLMGNLYAESALKPTNLQNSYETKLGYSDDTYTDAVDNGSYTNFVRDSAGYGLAQWTYWSRKQALLTYCQDKKTSIGNLTAQLEFLWKEIQGYTTVLSTLKNATSVKAASDIVLTKYEAPADQSDAVKTKRASYGQTYFDKYTGSGKTESQVTTPVTSTKTYKIEYAASKESGHGSGKKLTVTTGLNFRTGAGTNKTIIRVLAQGEVVTWYGYYTTVSGTRWYLVVDKNGQTGFVSSKYLD